MPRLFVFILLCINCINGLFNTAGIVSVNSGSKEYLLSSQQQSPQFIRQQTQKSPRFEDNHPNPSLLMI